MGYISLRIDFDWGEFWGDIWYTLAEWVTQRFLFKEGSVLIVGPQETNS